MGQVGLLFGVLKVTTDPDDERLYDQFLYVDFNARVSTDFRYRGQVFMAGSRALAFAEGRWATDVEGFDHDQLGVFTSVQGGFHPRIVVVPHKFQGALDPWNWTMKGEGGMRIKEPYSVVLTADLHVFASGSGYITLNAKERREGQKRPRPQLKCPF